MAYTTPGGQTIYKGHGSNTRIGYSRSCDNYYGRNRGSGFD